MGKTPIGIRGLGIINGLGLGRTQYWESLLRSSSGFAPIRGPGLKGSRKVLGSQIHGFDPRDWMPPRFYRRLSRLSRLSVAASIEAVLDGALSIQDRNRHRIGCVFGTAFGSTDQTDAFYVSLLDHGPDGAEPFLFPDTVPNALASHVALFHQLQGPNSTICQNHLSGEGALAYAASLLESGHAEALVVGGADELSPILIHSLSALRALKELDPSDEPFRTLWNPSARGYLPGEGATCLVVEHSETTHGRHEDPYGTLDAVVLAGSRASQTHYEADGEALATAVAAALDEAEVKPEAIDLIGSTVNGIAELTSLETRVLERVFGPRWIEIPRFPSRCFTGEFGSAGLLAAATLLLALREGILPPHGLGPDSHRSSGSRPALAAPRKARLRHAMVVGATFGGGAGCLVLSAPSVHRGDS